MGLRLISALSVRAWFGSFIFSAIVVIFLSHFTCISFFGSNTFKKRDVFVSPVFEKLFIIV